MVSTAHRNPVAPTRVPKKGASLRPCDEYGLTGHGRMRRRTRRFDPGVEALRSSAHRHSPAPGRAEQVKPEESQPAGEFKHPQRRSAHGMIDSARPVGKAGSQEVRSVDGRIRGKRRHGETPGKRITQQAMQEDQGRPRACPQVAHPGAVDLHPALFDALTWIRGSRNVHLLHFCHRDSRIPR